MAYAIFRASGRQFRVAEGDVIKVNRLGAEAGAETTFSDVLFYADGDKVKSSAGDLQNVSVVAEVVGDLKGKKVIAYKFRRRKGYHRTVGHRQKLTQLRIKSITI